jgi:class 3 adenylate cyclase
MQCPKCQFKNPEDSNFCLKCGSKLELHCPQCEIALPAESMFCNKCGHDLRKSAEAQPIDYSEPQTYTPKFLADKILTSRSSIEGERKLVTVLFADVANYTAIAEKLDPEEVHQIMDGCFKILMDEIHKYEGTINQFTGDGVMALFGAPVAHEDHAQRACHAALSIQKTLEVFEEKTKKDFGADFKMRIGLNSGPVIVGSIGDDLRMDYTAVGDTSNLASRIENMARPGTSLVSIHTHRLAKDYFEFEALGKMEVKGKKEPQEIFELVKAGEVDTRIAASEAKGLTRFVGRKNSMAALMNAYEKTQSGSGQVVGVVGDAGVGKSRLLLEFKNRLSQDEISYFEGRCLHFGGAMAFLPILDIIRTYFEIKEGDHEFVIKENMAQKIRQLDEKLHSVLPPFHELLSLNIEDEAYQNLDPMQKREKTFEAIRDLLVRESQNRPVILVIEDLHWIDKSSEEFLDYLIGLLAGTRVLLLLLYRPEYTHPWGSKSYYDRIGLDQLTAKSSTELIQAILPGGKPVPELRELILNRAAGNPLYMEEFTHTLLENGSIQCKEQQCVLIKNASEIQVPDTIQGIIAARMDRLEDDLKRTMQVASVIGRDFAFRILETITEMREELKSYLLNLQGLEFIYEKSLFPEPTTACFKSGERRFTKKSARPSKRFGRIGWKNSTRCWPIIIPKARIL